MLVFALSLPPALLGAVLLLGRFEDRLTEQLSPPQPQVPPVPQDAPASEPAGPGR